MSIWGWEEELCIWHCSVGIESPLAAQMGQKKESVLLSEGRRLDPEVLTRWAGGGAERCGGERIVCGGGRCCCVESRDGDEGWCTAEYPGMMPSPRSWLARSWAKVG